MATQTQSIFLNPYPIDWPSEYTEEIHKLGQHREVCPKCGNVVSFVFPEPTHCPMCNMILKPIRKD